MRATPGAILLDWSSKDVSVCLDMYPQFLAAAQMGDIITTGTSSMTCKLMQAPGHLEHRLKARDSFTDARVPSSQPATASGLLTPLGMRPASVLPTCMNQRMIIPSRKESADDRLDLGIPRLIEHLARPSISAAVFIQCQTSRGKQRCDSFEPSLFDSCTAMSYISRPLSPPRLLVLRPSSRLSRTAWGSRAAAGQPVCGRGCGRYLGYLGLGRPGRQQLRFGPLAARASVSQVAPCMHISRMIHILALPLTSFAEYGRSTASP